VGPRSRGPNAPAFSDLSVILPLCLVRPLFLLVHAPRFPCSPTVSNCFPIIPLLFPPIVGQLVFAPSRGPTSLCPLTFFHFRPASCLRPDRPSISLVLFILRSDWRGGPHLQSSYPPSREPSPFPPPNLRSLEDFISAPESTTPTPPTPHHSPHTTPSATTPSLPPRTPPPNLP